MAQSVKNLPAVEETRVQSLSWEDPLEKEIATHSSILAWRIPWTEEAGRLQSLGLQESDMAEQLSTAHIFLIDMSIQVLCSFKNCVCLFVVAFIFLKQD